MKQSANQAAGRGFTLIELLVAISILAIVAVLGWRGLDGIIRARTALTAQLESTRGMQLAFAQMQSDCEHLATPSMLIGRPYLLSGPDRMTLVRNVFLENEPARLQVVAYRVVGGMLTRRESNGTRDLTELDVMWKATTSDIDTSVPVTLQSGVSAMQIMTWENNSWRLNANPLAQPATGQAPVTPPLSALNLPPTGLQVSLQLSGNGSGTGSGTSTGNADGSPATPMNKSFLLGGL